MPVNEGFRRAYRGKDPSFAKDKFNVETFEKVANDIKSGVVPVDPLRISDSQQRGLRVSIRGSGTITYHVQYQAEDGTRPFIKLGTIQDLTVEQARTLARTISTLGEMGIDVQAGLHKRLIRELLDKGLRWRP